MSRAERPTAYYESLIPHVPMGDAIPKHIYQIFIGGNIASTSPKILNNIEYIQQLNPGWTYQLFDEVAIRAFILEHYGVTVWRYYRMISPSYRAARADFFRYLLIYRLGGVYMDIKASCYTPLDDNLLPSDKYILYHWDNAPDGRYPHVGYFAEVPHTRFPNGEFPQGFILSVAGHPFLREIIIQVMRRLDSYHPLRHPVGLHGVLCTTGPIMYTLTISELLPETDPSLYRHIRRAEDIGLRVSIFDDEAPNRHRKIYSTYHNKVTAVSRNGSHYWTTILYPYFWWRRVSAILRDKRRRGEYRFLSWLGFK